MDNGSISSSSHHTQGSLDYSRSDSSGSATIGDIVTTHSPLLSSPSPSHSSRVDANQAPMHSTPVIPRDIFIETSESPETGNEHQSKQDMDIHQEIKYLVNSKDYDDSRLVNGLKACLIAKTTSKNTFESGFTQRNVRDTLFRLQMSRSNNTDRVNDLIHAYTNAINAGIIDCDKFHDIVIFEKTVFQMQQCPINNDNLKQSVIANLQDALHSKEGITKEGTPQQEVDDLKYKLSLASRTKETVAEFIRENVGSHVFSRKLIIKAIRSAYLDNIKDIMHRLICLVDGDAASAVTTTGVSS